MHPLQLFAEQTCTDLPQIIRETLAKFGVDRMSSFYALQSYRHSSFYRLLVQKDSRGPDKQAIYKVDISAINPAHRALPVVKPSPNISLD